jgi:hypothetical protein
MAEKCGMGVGEREREMGYVPDKLCILRGNQRVEVRRVLARKAPEGLELRQALSLGGGQCSLIEEPKGARGAFEKLGVLWA